MRGTDVRAEPPCTPSDFYLTRTHACGKNNTGLEVVFGCYIRIWFLCIHTESDHLERLKQWEDLVSLDKLLQLSLELTLGHKVTFSSKLLFQNNLVLKVSSSISEGILLWINYTETIKCIGYICCGKPFCLTWIIKANVLECKDAPPPQSKWHVPLYPCHMPFPSDSCPSGARLHVLT